MFAYLAKNKFFRYWFGDFESGAELAKFVFLGVIFAMVIGVYWTLRPLKVGIFTSIVHDPKEVIENPKMYGYYVGFAKMLSLFVLLPCVMLYSRAVERIPRHYMFYILGAIYAVLLFSFGYYFRYSPHGLEDTVGSPWRLIGWAWYVLVESFGSLMVVLFWAFAQETTTVESSKRGFPLAIMLGQLGSILGPMFLTPLGKTYFKNSGPVLFILAGFVVCIALGVWLFLRITPTDQLTGFQPKEQAGAAKPKHRAGFFEGLNMLLSSRYLLGMFAIISIFEILATIIDLNFQSVAAGTFLTEAARTEYMGNYAMWVNIVAAVCMFLGVNRIARAIGVRKSLAMMPFAIGGLLAIFLMYDKVGVLFWLMVFVKAINYALNGPTMKQLYVPTSTDVKYKAQTWMETFGSRGAKAVGSGIKQIQGLLGPYFFLFTSTIGFGLCTFWFLLALYLGTQYQRSVDKKELVV